jgi:hypothetical protein
MCDLGTNDVGLSEGEQFVAFVSFGMCFVPSEPITIATIKPITKNGVLTT